MCHPSVSLKGLSIRIEWGKTDRQTPNSTRLINQFQSIAMTYKNTIIHLLLSSASDEPLCLGHAEKHLLVISGKLGNMV
jgi:hypothetical protein